MGYHADVCSPDPVVEIRDWIDKKGEKNEKNKKRCGIIIIIIVMTSATIL